MYEISDLKLLLNSKLNKILTNSKQIAQLAFPRKFGENDLAVQ